jgi:hypothetical protein
VANAGTVVAFVFQSRKRVGDSERSQNVRQTKGKCLLVRESGYVCDQGLPIPVPVRCFMNGRPKGANRLSCENDSIIALSVVQSHGTHMMRVRFDLRHCLWSLSHLDMS